jgi:hypothetical protein
LHVDFECNNRIIGTESCPLAVGWSRDKVQFRFLDRKLADEGTAPHSIEPKKSTRLAANMEPERCPFVG